MICCGVWSPRVARMAGASIPLTPAVHQMIDIGPVPRFADAKSAIEFPIVRDMDTNMYERQDGSGLEVGSTRIARSSTIPTRSPRSRRPRCRRPSSRSRRTTSRLRWSTRSS